MYALQLARVRLCSLHVRTSRHAHTRPCAAPHPDAGAAACAGPPHRHPRPRHEHRGARDGLVSWAGIQGAGDGTAWGFSMHAVQGAAQAASGQHAQRQRLWRLLRPPLPPCVRRCSVPRSQQCVSRFFDEYSKTAGFTPGIVTGKVSRELAAPQRAACLPDCLAAAGPAWSEGRRTAGPLLRMLVAPPSRWCHTSTPLPTPP